MKKPAGGRDEPGRRPVWLLLSVLSLSPSCTDRETIFGEGPFFERIPAEAAGYLGYSTELREAQQTLCGQCHATEQSEWIDTHHAEAWEDLQASGSAQAFCEPCHTTNQRGSPSDVPGGFVTTGDPRYYDVQCENCHGPGDAHASSPGATQPLASLAVAEGVGCGGCHEGSHQPFVDEWSQSRHADIVGFAAAREECAGCHRGQGALIAWGVQADYLERDSPDPLATVCGVCHDPHGSPYDAQLRFPVKIRSFETHLCSRCHDRQTSPDPGSSRGLAPHSPETGLLKGTAGWIPTGVEIDERVAQSTHGSERNEALCARCHVENFTVSDSLTGAFEFTSTGHLFLAIPCVDEEGRPIGGDCELSTEARRFDACTGSGCHGSVDGALFVLNRAGGRISDQALILLRQLEVVDPNLDGPGGEIDASDPTFTVAEGAFFNYNLSIFQKSGEQPEITVLDVAGSTTHNPFHMEALVAGSICAVEDRYGVAPVGFNCDAELSAVLERAGMLSMP